MPISLVVRTRMMPARSEVLALYAKGMTTREVANQCQITDSWARRIKQEHRERGVVANAVGRKRKPGWLALEPRIREAYAEKADLTLQELKAKLGTEFHTTTLCRALKALGLTLKKGPDRHRTRPP